MASFCPTMALSKVDLPTPEEPSSTTVSPTTSNERSSPIPSPDTFTDAQHREAESAFLRFAPEPASIGD